MKYLQKFPLNSTEKNKPKLFFYSSLFYFRVNAAMQQLEEFQTIFNCPKKALMNAQTKCRII